MEMGPRIQTNSSPLNPFDTPRVLTMIQKRKSQTGKNNDILDLQRNATANCLLGGLPLEIKYITLDHPQYREVQTVKTAVGLQVDNEYWRNRYLREKHWRKLPCDTLLFELQELCDDDRVNWGVVYSFTKNLDTAAMALENRERIVQRLLGPRDDFLRELKQIYCSLVERCATNKMED